jgi:HAD superfamily hydrolase (TIGR01509 family)
MQFGALFDWDGVIIDSSAQHKKSWERIAQEENLPIFEGHFEKGFGMRNEQVIPHVLNWTNDRAEILRISLKKEEMYRTLLDEEGSSTLPGVVDFLFMLREAGIPCAIAFSGHRENIEMALDMLEIKHYFESIVASDDVINGKPDPQVFLLAAERLAIAPIECIMFEDAPVGIAAARAGGMKVVAVATTHPVWSLSEADIVVNRLDELNRFRLDGLFAHSPGRVV